HFDMPVLFITGDEDFICPSKLLERCFEDIEAPVKKMVTIKKATHTCFYDQPEEFLRVVWEFVG
ncbi:MAG: alpha/beta hydrolase, partial [Eubacterium sp.]|nr:alpha/beta hydrolase [Eubacterium sp.]